MGGMDDRGVSICSVWLAVVFVWRLRVLEQKLLRQIEIISEAGSRRRHFGNGGPVYTINI
jgi:hypothetical protein